MAVTSRRAGKTTSCAFDLLSTAYSKPNSTCLYIITARTNAKKVLWPMICELNRKYGLGGVSNESDLSLKFSNGSIIYLSGAATAKEIDRFLGLSLTLTYIDECQSIPGYIKELIDKVLVPASIDRQGRIRLIGTPPPVPVGYYAELWQKSDKISKHFWTMWDNPWIKDPEGELELEIERRGVTKEDPTIQREFFGQFVIDSKKLVFDYNPLRNHFDAMPLGKWNHLMGIDIGYEDADAICVLAYCDRSSTTYLVDELITTKQGFTDLVGQIETLRKKYNPHKLMIDEGGLGKKLAEEMRRRYRIPVQAAEKQRKFETIEMMNDSLRTKRLFAKSTSRFANDSQLMEWDFDKSTPDRKVVSDRFHSDICDAVLYAFKESPAYAWEPEPVKPKAGTPEWGKRQEEEMYEKALEHFTESAIESGMEFL